METNNNINSLNKNEREIDIGELFNVLWIGKWIIIAITTSFSIFAILYSLSLPNIYQSKAILSAVESSGGNGLSQAMKSYGGLASLAGVNLSSSDSGSNSSKAIEKIKTLSFFEKNILPNIFLPDLMAVDYWDASNNKLEYNRDVFNEDTQSWTGYSGHNKNKIPSPQESFNAFGGHLQIIKDVDTSFITVAIKHKSPFVAKAWTELVVNQLNNFFREKDKKDAEAAMNYLNIQMSQTSFAEIKLVIAQLLQQKMQQLTLIEAGEFYVFDYIDPPAVMETKSEPVRSLICIIGAFLGGILGCLVVIVRYYFFDKKVK